MTCRTGLGDPKSAVANRTYPARALCRCQVFGCKADAGRLRSGASAPQRARSANSASVSRASARVSALASVAPDYAEIGKRAARMVAELLGKPPEQRVPVPPPSGSPGALTINLKTARQLGLEISSGVQSKARQVFK